MNSQRTGTDTPEAVVRRFLDEVVNGGRHELIGELWATDLTWRGGSLGEIHGINAYQDYMAANATGAFTGMHLVIQDVITENDKVVVRFTNSGTHTGPFLGTAATGKYAEWPGVGIYTVAGGKITEAWFAEDILAMLLQLGTITLPSHQ
jgi:predicted ester cyclase